MKKRGEIPEGQLSKDELNELVETLLRGEGGDNAESTETQSLDENAFGDEGTIELTEVVEEGDSKMATESPKAKLQKLEEEIQKAGGKIDSRELEDGFLAIIRNEREEVYVILINNEPDFLIFGDERANEISSLWKDMAYQGSESADHFIELSKEAKRELSCNDEKIASRKAKEQQQNAG